MEGTGGDGDVARGDLVTGWTRDGGYEGGRGRRTGDLVTGWIRDGGYEGGRGRSTGRSSHWLDTGWRVRGAMGT